MLLLLGCLMAAGTCLVSGAPARSSKAMSESSLDKQDPATPSRNRASKALGFLTDAYLDQPGTELERAAQGFTGDLSIYDDGLQDPLPQPQDVFSRSRPPNNSPIYYIRLPPEPYVFVPGLGYVSRPPQMMPPPVIQPGPESNMIHLPTKYISNAKPTGIYTLAKPNAKPSPIHHLDKGPYYFNGKPADLYMLRNIYNSLYDDALQNFYP